MTYYSNKNNWNNFPKEGLGKCKSRCNLKKCDLSKIDQAKQIDLTDCNLEKIPDEIYSATNLVKLKLDNNRIKEIRGLPYSLKDLSLSNNFITKIIHVPEEVKDLNLPSNGIIKIENLPDQLENLNLNKNNLLKIENLPDSLYELRVANNFINKIENLPKDLNYLDIQDNPIPKRKAIQWKRLPDQVGNLVSEARFRKDYKKGSIIKYKPDSSTERTIKVTEKKRNLKNGYPGFLGAVLDSSKKEEMDFLYNDGIWGYEYQISDIVKK